MADLEDSGYIAQPHTSAGRAPTEKGYQYYIQNLTPKSVTKSEATNLDNAENPKELARYLASRSANAVFLALDDNYVYITGIANVFSQPEFFEHETVSELSEALDHIEDMVRSVDSMLDEQLQIMLGSKNPLSRDLTLLLGRGLRHHDRVIGMLGPMRMDYARNMALLDYARQILYRF